MRIDISSQDLIRVISVMEAETDRRDMLFPESDRSVLANVMRKFNAEDKELVLRLRRAMNREMFGDL